MKHRTRTAPSDRKSIVIFTHDEQIEIVKRIAIYQNYSDIIKMAKDKWGKRLSNENLRNYSQRPNWQPYIQKFREEFEAKITDEDLASKRRRIQELSKMYHRLEVKDEYLSKAATMLGMIREEIEGKSSGNMQITQYNQYNGLSDEDLRKSIAENNRFLEIAEKRKQELTVEPINGDGD